MKKYKFLTVPFDEAEAKVNEFASIGYTVEHISIPNAAPPLTPDQPVGCLLTSEQIEEMKKFMGGNLPVMKMQNIEIVNISPIVYVVMSKAEV